MRTILMIFLNPDETFQVMDMVLVAEIVQFRASLRSIWKKLKIVIASIQFETEVQSWSVSIIADLFMEGHLVQQ